MDPLPRRSYPGQRSTGTRGYFGNRSGSSFARPHIEKTDPRVLRMIF